MMLNDRDVIDRRRSIGLAFKKIRVKKNISKKQLIKWRLLSSKRMILEYERGVRDVRLTSLVRMCEAIGEGTHEIFKLAELIQASVEIDHNKIFNRGLQSSKYSPSRPFEIELGKVLKGIREAKGLSRNFLGNEANLRSTSTITHLESGQRCPRLILMYQVCAVLGVKVSYVAKLLDYAFIPESKSFRYLRPKHSRVLKDDDQC